MAKKNTNSRTILLLVFLFLGCAKSSTRLGRAEDGGDATLDDAGREVNGRDENGGSSSDAYPEAQTGLAESAGAEGIKTDGTWIEDSGGHETTVIDVEVAGTGVGGYGGSNETPPQGDAAIVIDNTQPGREILNPQGCASDQPFVLGINPDGSSGFVEGWLESASSVVFEGELPRFNSSVLGQGGMSLWWSISTYSNDNPDFETTVYFYGTGDSTSVAIAEGVERVQEISDASAFSYDEWVTREVEIGTIILFHHIPTDRYLALRLDDVYSGYSADPGAGLGFCAAISASWVFAPVGSADFSSVELPDDSLNTE